MSDFFWFSDAQWARIGPLLPTDTRGMARVDDRRVLSGIVHALRNGGRWADCPREVYGPKKTLYNRFVRWAERGIWERIFSALAGGEDARPSQLFHLRQKPWNSASPSDTLSDRHKIIETLPAVFRKLFVGRAAPHTELLTLRQQGAVLKRKRSRPALRMSDGINRRDKHRYAAKTRVITSAFT